jgi:hypothetical protein
VARSRKGGSIPALPIRLNGVVHRDKFTFYVLSKSAFLEQENTVSLQATNEKRILGIK